MISSRGAFELRVTGIVRGRGDPPHLRTLFVFVFVFLPSSRSSLRFTRVLTATWVQEIRKASKDLVIDGKSLEYLQKLGAGASGEVYKGLYRQKPVAIKARPCCIHSITSELPWAPVKADGPLRCSRR